METLWLRVRAPFAAFRPFQAGVYRATSPVMPPSAAYGLLLNLAGVEMREPSVGPATLIRGDVPSLQLAVGIVTLAERSSLYQQLHSYPVGNSGAELRPRTHGAKYWVAPGRRELLVGYDGVIGVRSAGQPELLDRVRRGLCGESGQTRYGLPFAGDNNFLYDRIDISTPPPSTIWYTPVLPDDPPRRGSCRLTVGINREDNSRTTAPLFAPAPETSPVPPESAWIWTPRPPGQAL
jgi:CRISPR-associated protein Cas5t